MIQGLLKPFTFSLCYIPFPRATFTYNFITEKLSFQQYKAKFLFEILLLTLKQYDNPLVIFYPVQQ